MSPYLAGGLFIGFLAWSSMVGYGGYAFGTDKLEAATLAAVEAEKIKHKADQDAADAKAAKYEADIASEKLKTSMLNQKLEGMYGKVANDCAVPANLIGMRNATINQ